MLPPPPRPTLFPYTTLFRSAQRHLHLGGMAMGEQPVGGEIPGDGGEGGFLLEGAAGAGHARRGIDKDRRPVGQLYQRSEEHTSELQSQSNLVCRLLLEKKKG